MSAVLNDLKYAVRGLLRTPGFTIVALLTLALGIGANSAIFSVVNGVVLKPLGYPQPERLMFITSQFPGLGFDKFWVSPPEYFEFRERNRAFEEVGAYSISASNLGDAGTEPMRVTMALVTPPLLKVLGVPPERGRAFADADGLPNAPDVGILSHELWQRAFNGDAGVIGRAIDIDGTKTTIVGIMPPRYDVHDEGVELWLPITLDPTERVQRRGNHFLYLVGRLKAGVTPERANADLQAVLQRYEAENPPPAPGAQGNGVHAPNRTNHRLQMESLQSEVVGTARKALLVLQGAVVFVLLIACANMANLLLARAESRHKEFAIRSALGADRLRLLRQFMTEGVLLSVLGGVLGLTLSFVGVRALLKANEESIPRAAEVGVDPTVLAVTLLVAVGTGIVFGLAPMLHLGQKGVSLALKEGGRRSTATMGRLRLRRGLVIAEVGLAVVLVIGAGLMLRSFWNLMNVDAGFDRRNLSTFGLVLPGATYQDANRRVQLFREVTTRLSQLPGVESAAAMTGLPPRRQVNANDTQIEGLVPGPNTPPQNVDYYQYVTRDYLKTMGIPLVEGRSFNASDDAAATPVVMVNETMARVFWPNQSAIGRRVKPGGGTTPWFTVVGVVKDVKQGGVESKTGTELYFSYEQVPGPLGFAPRNLNVVVRSNRDPAALAAGIRQTVTSLDRLLPIVQLRSMEDVFSQSAARPRFLMQLLGIFALLALALAAVGTYGVLSYTVQEREREIGIRMALGADRGSVVGMVLRQGLWMVAGGLAIGVGGAIALRTVVASMLFNVRPEDPTTYAAVAVFITLVAIVASFIPARRATKVDPMVALRTD